MFDKSYCINHPNRTDRWEESLSEFDKICLKVERFDGSAPFNHSQLNCLKQASRFNSSLILEDDVEFVKWDHLDMALASLPKDWDLVSLGATLVSTHKKRVNEYLYRYEDGWATHAVGYTKKMMKWIVSNFNPDGGVIYDEWLRLNVLKHFNCYIIQPMVAYQRPSFSDYRNRYVDYTGGFLQSEKMFL